MYCYDPNNSKKHTETSVIPHYQMLKLGFLQFDDLITDQGDFAIIVSFDQNLEHPSLEAYTTIPSSNISNPLVPVYLSACDITSEALSSDCINITTQECSRDSEEEEKAEVKEKVENVLTLLSTKKKYKPVAQKTKSVLAELPQKFRVVRKIEGNPLKDMPVLDPNPPPFQPCRQYMQDRKDKMDKQHPGDFLLPDERALLHHFICKQNEGFAWDDSERGSFRTDFFPPIDFPVVPHTPWVEKNIPIPPGIYEEVCEIVRKKIEAGVYEPPNSSYRSK